MGKSRGAQQVTEALRRMSIEDRRAKAKARRVRFRPLPKVLGTTPIRRRRAAMSCKNPVQPWVRGRLTSRHFEAVRVEGYVQILGRVTGHLALEVSEEGDVTFCHSICEEGCEFRGAVVTDQFGQLRVSCVSHPSTWVDVFK